MIINDYTLGVHELSGHKNTSSRTKNKQVTVYYLKVSSLFYNKSFNSCAYNFNYNEVSHYVLQKNKVLRMTQNCHILAPV